MQRIYFIALLIVSALAAIFAIPNVAFTAFLYTIGIAMVVLVPLPYILIGLWALCPAMIVWHTKILRLPLLAVGALIFASAIYGPQYLSDKGLKNDLAARSFVDAAPIYNSHTFGIEIRRPATRHPDLYVLKGKSGALFGSQPCFELCEQLLTGGDVAWVRIILVDDAFGNKKATTSALLRHGDNAECSRINPDLSPGEGCVLFVADHGRLADLTLTLDEGLTSWTVSPLTPYQPKGYRSAAVYAGPDTNALLLFNSMQIFHERPTGGIWFHFVSFGPIIGERSGLQFGRSRSASKPIDINGAFEKMGIAIGPIRPLLPKYPGTENNNFIASPPDAQDAIFAASLISSDSPSASSNAFSQVVHTWHDRLRRKTSFSKSERSIFCATLAHAEIKKQIWADQIIKKHSVSCGLSPH